MPVAMAIGAYSTLAGFLFELGVKKEPSRKGKALGREDESSRKLTGFLLEDGRGQRVADGFDFPDRYVIGFDVCSRAGGFGTRSHRRVVRIRHAIGDERIVQGGADVSENTRDSHVAEIVSLSGHTAAGIHNTVHGDGIHVAVQDQTNQAFLRTHDKVGVGDLGATTALTGIAMTACARTRKNNGSGIEQKRLRAIQIGVDARVARRGLGIGRTTDERDGAQGQSQGSPSEKAGVGRVS
jgi:hypothetical protein